jgi:sec-independent protein translocase protein TatA
MFAWRREGYPVRETSPEGTEQMGTDVWVVIVIGVVVIFGASKLPQIARNMGKAQGEFKKGLKEGVDGEEPVAPATPPANPPSAPPAQHIPPAQPPTDAAGQPPVDGTGTV